MEPSIETILRQNYTDGIYHTHVSLIQPHGKYQFNRQTLEEFWKNYCDLIESKTFNLGVAEKPQQHVPVLVDIDLKMDVEKFEDDKLYTLEQVKQIIKAYHTVLRSIIEDLQDSNLTCVLLEKPAYKTSANGKTFVKNGFHLHFPEIFFDKVDQEVHLIPRTKTIVKEEMVFANLGIEDSGEVIDKSCCSVPWLLYGSKKEEGANPYKISKIFNSSLTEISIDDAFKHYLIYDNHGRAISMKNRISYFIPRILSILPYGRDVKEIKNGLIPPLKTKPTKVKEQKVYDKLTTQENLKMAKRLLPLLADYRADHYIEWMTIGWVLYNISDGSEEGFALWLDFSARCTDKFDEAKCIYEWDRITKTDMTIGTLKYYASIDSPEKYKEFKKENSDKLIQDSLAGSHNDIAKILYAEYGNEFVCASISGRVWYQFVSHRWELIEGGVYLREKISSVIVNMFKEGAKKMYDTENTKDDEQLMSKVKQVTKIIQNLKNASFKDNIMKEACEVFYDKRFKDKLDTNPFLIAFKNGIYDLKEDVFRSGRPEDFISKSMPINFKQFAEDDKKVQEIYSFLEKIFPDKSVRTYFQDTASEIFMGGNHRKIFQMWTGDGDNGKSITQMFFELMLGNSLSIKIPTTIVTSKKPISGSAWPELARAGGSVRAAWIEEIDDSEEIYTGIVKHLTGNDSFMARDLFEKGKDTKEIKPMFKLFFICNKPPKFVGGGDKATWNRARVVPFESTFCRENDPAPDTYEEQLRQKRFPMDKDFAAKIPDLVEAFAWVLLQHRTKPKMMIDPEKVRTATNEYRQRNDIYRQFIEENIIEDAQAELTLLELYTHFKDWFKDSLPNHRVAVKNDVKQYFVRIWGDPDLGCKWSGYKIRTLEDDIKDGNAFVINTEVRPPL
jgi:phage/plasmid-associated DNA primase